MDTSEIEKKLKNSLTVGDSTQKVKLFLDQQGWRYVYDDTLHRFQARNMDEDSLPEVAGRNIIYIYTDNKHNYKSSEVLKIFP